MATGNWTDAGDTVLNRLAGGVYVLKNTVDMTDVIANTDVTGAATDVIQCLPIPANTLVTDVIVEITTVSGVASSTLDIGDGSDADGWDAAIAATALATIKGDGAYCRQTAGGKVYTADDTIDVTIKVAATVLSALEFKIWAVCIPIN